MMAMDRNGTSPYSLAMTSGVRAVLAAAASAALLLTACGGDDDADSSQEPSGAEATQDEETGLPAQIAIADVPTVPIEDRLVSEIEIQGGPDRMVFDSGSLWVKRDEGVVTRVAPAGAKVVRVLDTRPYLQ